MNNSVKFIATLLICVLVSMCGQPTETDQDLYTVRGTLVDARGVIVGATVAIDEVINWTTTTDVDGTFEIRDVSSGDHIMRVQNTEPSGSFIEREYNLAVYADVVLSSLMLPMPVVLAPPEDVGCASMSLHWNQTDAEDFREYKLYRHNSPGLDENTGLLVYIGTKLDDTSYTDIDLLANMSYYYRVYVMNQFGRLGGSNIVDATTIIANLIPDGGFEDTTSLAKNWSIIFCSSQDWYSLIYDDSIKVGGGYSLHLRSPIPVAPHQSGIEMRLARVVPLVTGSVYELSCWMRAMGEVCSDVPLLIEDNEAHGLYFESGGFPGESQPVEMDWTYKSVTFLKDTEEAFTLNIYIPFEHVWIDSISLVPVVSQESP